MDENFSILPPEPGTCSICAVKHRSFQPHNKDSLYYQTKFNLDTGRTPNWADAMAHCKPLIKEAWTRELKQRGVPDSEFILNTRKEGYRDGC